MPKYAEKFDWDNEELTIQEIADRLDVSYNTAQARVLLGFNSTDKALPTIQRKTKPAVKIVHPKLETRPIPRVNENAIVRVQDEKLHLMLEYLAKRTNSTYQAAFNAFICFIAKGNVWGKFSEERIISILNGGDIEDLQGEDAYSYEHSQSRAELALLNLISELEAENKELRQDFDKFRKRIRGILGDE